MTTDEIRLMTEQGAANVDLTVENPRARVLATLRTDKVALEGFLAVWGPKVRVAEAQLLEVNATIGAVTGKPVKDRRGDGKQQLVQLFADGTERTTSQAYLELGLTDGSLSWAFSDLVKEGKLVRVSRGRYQAAGSAQGPELSPQFSLIATGD